MANAPHKIEDTWARDASLKVNGTLVGTEAVRIQRGRHFTISGTVTLDSASFNGTIIQYASLRLMPAEATDDEWGTANRDWTWLAKKTLGLDGREYECTFNVDPGLYDARLYLFLQGELDDLPVLPLVANLRFLVEEDADKD